MHGPALLVINAEKRVRLISQDSECFARFEGVSYT